VPFGITSLFARGMHSRASRYFPKGTHLDSFGGGGSEHCHHVINTGGDLNSLFTRHPVHHAHLAKLKMRFDQERKDPIFGSLIRDGDVTYFVPDD
jgi:hypothetical protein